MQVVTLDGAMPGLEGGLGGAFPCSQGLYSMAGEVRELRTVSSWAWLVQQCFSCSVLISQRREAAL